MTPQQQTVAQWMIQFGQNAPLAPVTPDYKTRELRAKLILEEALETISALGVDVHFKFVRNEEEIITAPLDLKPLQFCESIDGSTMVEVADGLADSLFVILGTAVAYGIDIEPIFQEVCRSNFSKAWTLAEVESTKLSDYGYYRIIDNICLATNSATPRAIVYDKAGKVIKSPSYSPANLWPILEKQITNVKEPHD